MGDRCAEDTRWYCGKDWVEWTRLLISGMIFLRNSQSDLISISKSPIVVLKIKTMLASGYDIKAMYFGDSLDPFDWMRVYVSNPNISKNAKYFYTYEYGVVSSETGLLKFLRSIEEMFK